MIRVRLAAIEDAFGFICRRHYLELRQKFQAEAKYLTHMDVVAIDSECPLKAADKHGDLPVHCEALKYT